MNDFVCRHYWRMCKPEIGDLHVVFMCAICNEIKRVSHMELEIQRQKDRETSIIQGRGSPIEKRGQLCGLWEGGARWGVSDAKNL